MSKIPSFQFYPADWRKDPAVQALSYHDRGVWFEILCLMHESEQRGKLLLNGKPVPNEALARMLGLDKQSLTKTLNTLLEYGVCSKDQLTGALMNRRMVKDEELRKIRQEAGKMGGNPSLLKNNNNGDLQNLVNQNPTTHLKQNPTPSSSSSSSILNNNTNTMSKPKKPPDKKKYIISFDLEEKKFTDITYEQVKDWEARFSKVNVLQELKIHMPAWIEANWNNGKGQKTDWQKFILNWLSGQQRRAD